MTDRNPFASQIPTPSLDPLRVGEVMGLDAFSEGDWVLLRQWENKPTKVTHLQHNFVYVSIEEGEDFVDTLVHFYPEELGYPLDHRFWSNHQKRCYLRCHVDSKLLTKWQSQPSNPLAQDKTHKLCALGILLRGCSVKRDSLRDKFYKSQEKTLPERKVKYRTLMN